MYTWGTYDGSGAPIQLTFQDYYKRFVYDRDYAKPEKIGCNEIVKQGNSIINIRQAYPHSIFVESISAAARTITKWAGAV